MDIEGAFDNADFHSIEGSANNRELASGVVKWMAGMLRCRRISSELGESGMTVEATRGCPQGRVLSPLMWSLVVNDLLYELESNGFESVGYADDLVIMIRGKDDRTISERMQMALDMADR